MKIFVYSELNDLLQRQLRQSFSTHEVVFKKDLDNAHSYFNGADIILGNPPPGWFEQKHSVKFWQLDSAGFDQYSNVRIDGTVANMGDYFSVKCAETMVAGILAFYRKIHELVRLQVQSKWVGKPLRYEMDLLSSKRVIILGAGTIAQSIREMLLGFRCNVILTARKNPEAKITSREEFIAQLPGTDLVINTLPGKAHRYVDGEVFSAMRQGSVYASVGRGNTTDEKALISALESGKLAGAILDVTENEPLPVDSRLWTMENVILTQHTGGGHRLEDEGKINLFIQNTNRFLNGESVNNRIDLTTGY